MSSQDYLNYAASLSYTPPTFAEAVSTPYTVLSYGMYGNYFSSVNSFTKSDIDRARNSLVSLLLALQDKEETKEKKFFESYRARIMRLDPDFLSAFDQAYNKKEYSKLMTIIEQRRHGLYNTKLDIQKNIEKVSNEWARTQNKAFKDAFTKAIKQDRGRFGILNEGNQNILNRTFGEILDEAEQIFLEQAKKSASDNYLLELKEVWKEWRSIFLKNLSVSKFGSFDENTTLSKYRDSLSLDKLVISHKTSTGKNKKKTVNQFAQSIFYQMLMNGLSAEVFLDIGKGTVRVGQVQKKYGSISGTSDSVGSQQTDAISIFSGDINIETNFEQSVDDILRSEKDNIFERINSLLKIYEEDNFIIHYSAKDLYQYSTERRVQIRQSANLDTRVYELKQIASTLNRGDITDLIFAIANAGEGALMKGSSSEIQDAVTAMCAAWMFEDYEDTFKQIQSGTTNTHLHIYFINGNYYTVSQILGLTLRQLQAADIKSFISVSFNPSETDPYKEVNHDNDIVGIPRWEYVRNENLKNGKMGIRMNTKILEALLLNI